VKLPRGGLGASLLGLLSTALGLESATALQPVVNTISESEAASRSRFMPCSPNAWVKARQCSNPVLFVASESVYDYVSVETLVRPERIGACPIPTASFDVPRRFFSLDNALPECAPDVSDYSLK
jgi:hypothetical protein